MVYRNDVSNFKNDLLSMTKTDILRQLDQLDSLLEDLLFSLKPFSEEKLNQKPSEDDWSTLQICYHLMLAEKGSLAYVKKKLSYNPKLKKASLSTVMRQKLLTTYLITPIKVNSPDAISGDALPEKSNLEAVTLDWRAIRADLRAFLTNCSEDILDKEIYKHPFGGRLSLEGMLAFFEGHLQRHEKQIRKTLKAIG